MKAVLGKNTLDKFVEFGINVWGVDKTKGKEKIANAAIKKTRDFFTSLGMPSRLSAVSVPPDRFRDMAKGAIESYGRVGSFKKLSEEDIVKILTFSL